MSYRIEKASFKGHQTIKLFMGEQYIVSFGVGKAKAILECVSGIQEFVKENDNQTTNKSSNPRKNDYDSKKKNDNGNKNGNKSKKNDYAEKSKKRLEAIKSKDNEKPKTESKEKSKDKTESKDKANDKKKVEVESKEKKVEVEVKEVEVESKEKKVEVEEKPKDVKKEQKLLAKTELGHRDMKYIADNYGPFKVVVATGEVFDEDDEEETKIFDYSFMDILTITSSDDLPGEGYCKQARMFTRYEDDAGSDWFGGEHAYTIVGVYGSAEIFKDLIENKDILKANKNIKKGFKQIVKDNDL